MKARPGVTQRRSAVVCFVTDWRVSPVSCRIQQKSSQNRIHTVFSEVFSYIFCSCSFQYVFMLLTPGALFPSSHHLQVLTLYSQLIIQHLQLIINTPGKVFMPFHNCDNFWANNPVGRLFGRDSIWVVRCKSSAKLWVDFDFRGKILDRMELRQRIQSLVWVWKCSWATSIQPITLWVLSSS